MSRWEVSLLALLKVTLESPSVCVVESEATGTGEGVRYSTSRWKVQRGVLLEMVSPEGWTVCTVESYITGGTLFASLISCWKSYCLRYAVYCSVCDTSSLSMGDGCASGTWDCALLKASLERWTYENCIGEATENGLHCWRYRWKGEMTKTVCIGEGVTGKVRLPKEKSQEDSSQII